MTQTVENFVAEDEITHISTPNLTTEESERLLRCINDVRSGRRTFFVRVTNRKQTESAPRRPGEDFHRDPSLALHAHEGLLVKAPTNKNGEVYLHILDEARAPEGEAFGHTRVTMAGILSFKVLSERPGPLAQPAAQVAAPQAVNPQAAMAQAMMLQAQAMMMQAQAMMAMAMGLQGGGR